jgi:hypothetical protein
MAVDPITAAIDLVKTGVDKIWPDAGETERNRIQTIVTLTLAQMDVNKQEAASPSVFVAGWRPFIGWVCGTSLVYTYILYPFLLWASAIWAPELKPPQLVNDGMLFELMFGMLGLGAMRTFEKLKGRA